MPRWQWFLGHVNCIIISWGSNCSFISYWNNESKCWERVPSIEEREGCIKKKACRSSSCNRWRNTFSDYPFHITLQIPNHWRILLSLASHYSDVCISTFDYFVNIIHLELVSLAGFVSNYSLLAGIAGEHGRERGIAVVKVGVIETPGCLSPRSFTSIISFRTCHLEIMKIS